MFEVKLESDMNYLFVAKPSDYKYLNECLNAYKSIPTTEYIEDIGQTHIYSWENTVPNTRRLKYHSSKLVSIPVKKHKKKSLTLTVRLQI